MHSTLEKLLETDFISAHLSNQIPEQLYKALKESNEVIEAASMIPLISFDELVKFVQSIPAERGKRSSYDVTFAAMAVALEEHFSPNKTYFENHRKFAEDFLYGLSGLHIGELPISPAVAKIVLNGKYGSVN